MNKRLISLFLIIFLAGIAIRIFYIYQLPPYLDDDSSTVALMVVDILKGRIPVFFPGQTYNGSLEAIWLSLFVAVLGMSTAALFLGMVFLYIFFILTVYWMAKLIGGRYTGLWALAYCAVSPYQLLYDSVIPYGYHMVILIFGNLMLIFTILIAEKKRLYLWALLGLAGGIGFWNHFLIVYYIAACGVFLFLRIKIKNLFKYGLIAFIFFIIGGLPFWIYNFLTRFSSFNLYGGRPYIYRESETGYREILRIIFQDRLSVILGMRYLTGDIKLLVWIILAIIVLVFIILCRKRLLFVLLFVSIILIYSTKKYFVELPYYYYILPMYSVMPVVIGYIVSRFKYAGGVLLAAVLLFNAHDLSKGIKSDKAEFYRMYNFYKGFADFLSFEKIDGIYADFTISQRVTYLSKGRITGAELFDGRMPADEELQTRDRLGIAGYNELKPTIDMLCMRYEKKGKNFCGFQQYGYSGMVIEPSGWRGEGIGARYAYDRDLDKYWITGRERKKGTCFQLDLGKEYKIYRLEIFNIVPYLWNFPERYRVMVSSNGKDWKTVLIGSDLHPLFWSGPRLYWDVRHGRKEIIFKPVNARYVRIEDTEGGNDHWVINEIFVFEYAGDEGKEAEHYIKSAEEVYRYLADEGIKFIYADYWISGKIRKWSNEKIGTLRIENIGYPFRKNTSRLMEINKDTSILINEEMEEETDRILTVLKLPLEKKHIAGYIYYTFKNLDDWQKYFIENQKSLYWTGLCPVRINDYAYSRLLYNYGRYEDAVKIFPRNKPAREKMAEKYKGKEENKLRHLCYPKNRTPVEFANGIRFLGYSTFRHGRKMRIDYFWDIPKKPKDYLVVFVYFIKDDEIVLQGDYPLSESIARKEIEIPHDIKHGNYEIIIGLYVPSKDKRIKVKTGGLRKPSKMTIGEIKL